MNLRELAIYRVTSLSWVNPRTYKQIHTPLWYKREGGGGVVDGTPPQSFWYVAVFWNDFTFSFTFSGKPLIFLTRWGIFYGWWRCWRPVTSPTIVAILAAILDFTKNWKSDQVKSARNGNFLCFTWKITHKYTLCTSLAARFTFIVEKIWKNMYFHPKLAWPPATYDVISRNHSNWQSLNSSQNLCEGWTNSYWNVRCWCFFF